MRPSVPRPPSDWRKQYKVHPAADVFPMMSDDELAKLGEDIKANGLKVPVMFWYPPDDNEKVLLDGRNRLEAMERLGLVLRHTDENDVIDDDPVAHIISLNIHRRHLTKQQQADLIVAAHKAADKPRQVGEVSDDDDLPEFLDRRKGGRGRVDQVKAAAIATAKEHGISKRTVERAIARTEAKPLPEPKRFAGPRFRKKPQQAVTGLEAARKYYLEQCKGPEVDLKAELEIVINALREIAGNKATKGNGLISDCLHRRGEP